MSDSAQLTFDVRDEFNRREVAEKVIQLLNSDIQVSPMVIDGGWGIGKTEFCQKLIRQIEDTCDELQPVYVDAFVADHADEPLLTILAEVLRLIPDDQGRDDAIKKVLPALRFSLKTVAKGAVAHLLRQEAADVVDEFSREISQLAGKAIDASVERVLTDHIKANESLSALKAVLEELAAIKPIVVFIDELDRCRPDFAINMLEVIKHVFDVEGVKFVLVTNTQQLKAAINHRYGAAVDAQRYLDKFLKFSFGLPNFSKPSRRRQIQQNSISHCKNLVRSSTTLSDMGLADGGFFDIIERIIQVNDLSLREIETLVRHLEIYVVLDDSFRSSGRGYKSISLWGVALFTLQPEVAKSIIEGRADADKLGNLFGEDGLANWNIRSQQPQHHQVLLSAVGTECKYNAALYTPEAAEALDQWEERFNDIFGYSTSPMSGNRLQTLANAINAMNFSLAV